jgi:hypothetical protein
MNRRNFFRNLAGGAVMAVPFLPDGKEPIVSAAPGTVVIYYEFGNKAAQQAAIEAAKNMALGGTAVMPNCMKVVRV